MAKVTILYWQDIPSMVEARDASGRHKRELSPRFQELIDRVAMRQQLAGTDAYLAQWRRGPREDREGSAAEAAETTAAALEARYEAIRDEALSACRTPPA